MYSIYVKSHQVCIKGRNGDAKMKTAGEVVQYLNETGANIYALSESFGLGKTTLRKRLMNLGYTQSTTGAWMYAGDASTDPSNEDVVSKKRMVTSRDSSESNAMHKSHSQMTIHQSLMQLNLSENTTRTTVTIADSQIKEMKELATVTRLRLSDIYSLAIAEFLEKYDFYINTKEDK